MSFAFEGDCKNTVKYEDLAAGYYRDNADANDRFYQQGELYEKPRASASMWATSQPPKSITKKAVTLD